MSDLETALRAALGLPDPDTFQQDNPAAPLALNDDNGLRAIIMRGLKDEAQQTAVQKQAAEAMTPVLNSLNKK